MRPPDAQRRDTIVLVGVRPSVTPRGANLHVVAQRELSERQLPRCRLVVLGDAPIDNRLPVCELAWLRARSREVWLCPHVASYTCLARWVAGGVRTVVAENGLSLALENWARAERLRSSRLPLDPITESRHNASALLAALDSLRVITVDEWARALGISRHALKRRTVAVLRQLLSKVVWSRVQGRTEEIRRDGGSIADVARGLGWARGSTVTRAFARRAQALPPGRSKGVVRRSNGAVPNDRERP